MIRQPKKGMRIELHYAEKRGVRYVRHLQLGVIVIAPRPGRNVRNTLVRLDTGDSLGEETITSVDMRKILGD